MVNGANVFQDIDNEFKLASLRREKMLAGEEVDRFKEEKKEKLEERRILSKAKAGFEAEQAKKSPGISPKVFKSTFFGQTKPKTSIPKKQFRKSESFGNLFNINTKGLAPKARNPFIR